MKTVTIYEKDNSITFTEWKSIVPWCTRLAILVISEKIFSLLNRETARKLLYKAS